MYEFLKYEVRDAMTTNPVVISPQTTLREIEALFEIRDFNGVPVVDAQHRLLGMVTKFDVLKAFSFDAQSLVPDYETIMQQPAETVMTVEPVSVETRLPLSRLLQKLVDLRVKSLPVVEQGRLVGMIAREDVLKALRRATLQHAAPYRKAHQEPEEP